MKKELEGILGREGTQPCVKMEDGKTRLIYNLFDGFAGKNVRLTIETVPIGGETEEAGEIGWEDAEGEVEELKESGEIEEE